MTLRKTASAFGLSLALVFLLGFWIHSVIAKGGDEKASAQETTYERVMRTGVIRCGYGVWPPIIIKDPNTGALSGIYHDYVEALGRAMNLKIEWTKEVDLATYIQDLNEHKFDLECSGGWPDPLRGKQLYYTHPIFYLPFYLYAREGDTRFDNNLKAIDDPSVRFAIMDGDFSALVHDELFSKSQRVSVPSNGPFANLFLQLVHNKADVTGMDAFSGEPFFVSNPGQIRRIPSPPLRIIPNNLSMARGETDFLNMINVATDALINNGAIDRILDKYSFKEGTLFRVSKPYEVPSK